jgi:hypothetical protein
MSCFDWFKFEHDFKFKNHKGDIVIIPGGIEFQTKDFKNCMFHLQINSLNEIEKLVFETNINSKYQLNDPLICNIEFSHYEKIDFTGLMQIYHYTDEKDWIYDLWVEDGKIFKIEDKSK